VRTWGPSIATAVVLGALYGAFPGPAAAGHRPPEGAREAGAAETSSGMLRLQSPAWPRVRIPAGPFPMGSTPDDVVAALADCGGEPHGHLCDEEMFHDELPQRVIRLSAFWIDRKEVTVGEYARCVAAGHCRPLPFEGGARRFDRPRYPASLVTWNDARAYCAFRGARLPTEAEWERAARGREGRRYPWGNLYNDRRANHGRFAWSPTDDRDGYAELAPVGRFPQGATPEGVFDLAGNVAEWVHDRYVPRYLEQDLDDPQGPEPPLAGPARVVRGGSFEDAAPWLRGAARRAADPNTRSPTIGFRCAANDGGDR
jgi:formylglycine-generating enzyme